MLERRTDWVYEYDDKVFATRKNVAEPENGTRCSVVVLQNMYKKLCIRRDAVWRPRTCE